MSGQYLKSLKSYSGNVVTRDGEIDWQRDYDNAR